MTNFQTYQMQAPGSSGDYALFVAVPALQNNGPTPLAQAMALIAPDGSVLIAPDVDAVPVSSEPAKAQWSSTAANGTQSGPTDAVTFNVPANSTGSTALTSTSIDVSRYRKAQLAMAAGGGSAFIRPLLQTLDGDGAFYDPSVAQISTFAISPVFDLVAPKLAVVTSNPDSNAHSVSWYLWLMR